MQTFPNDAPLSHRRDDERTSKAAEQDLTTSGKRSLHKQIALDLVTQFKGMTGRELFAIHLRNRTIYDDMHLVDSSALTKRLSDLKHDGIVKMGEPRICRVTKKRAATWWVVEQQSEMFA